MPDNSPILSLPYIQPSQAQKHVTHNEAIEALDVLVQLVVAGFDAVEPPGEAAEGTVFALGVAPTGAWAGHGGELAARLGGGWRFFVPRDGWIAVEAASGAVRVRQGDGWTSGADAATTVPTLGVGTEADAVNRLAVAAEGTLLTHAGGGHRLTVNKAAPEETASLLFQTGWSGRAEMGLAGEDAWSIKVSLDGISWITALGIDPATGHVGGAAVQAGPGDVTPGRLMRAEWGYGPGNLVAPVAFADGLPSGGVVERGGDDSASYVRFADGTQICSGNFAESGVAFYIPRAGGFLSAMAYVAFAAPFAARPAITFSTPGHVHALSKGANVETTYFAPRFWSAVENTTDVEASYIAVGRWN